jgi:hypothetical protein
MRSRSSRRLGLWSTDMGTAAGSGARRRWARGCRRGRARCTVATQLCCRRRAAAAAGKAGWEQLVRAPCAPALTLAAAGQHRPRVPDVGHEQPLANQDRGHRCAPARRGRDARRGGLGWRRRRSARRGRGCPPAPAALGGPAQPGVRGRRRGSASHPSSRSTPLCSWRNSASVCSNASAAERGTTREGAARAGGEPAAGRRRSAPAGRARRALQPWSPPRVPRPRTERRARVLGEAPVAEHIFEQVVLCRGGGGRRRQRIGAASVRRPRGRRPRPAAPRCAPLRGAANLPLRGAASARRRHTCTYSAALAPPWPSNTPNSPTCWPPAAVPGGRLHCGRARRRARARRRVRTTVQRNGLVPVPETCAPRPAPRAPRPAPRAPRPAPRAPRAARRAPRPAPHLGRRAVLLLHALAAHDRQPVGCLAVRPAAARGLRRPFQRWARRRPTAQPAGRRGSARRPARAQALAAPRRAAPRRTWRRTPSPGRPRPGWSRRPRRCRACHCPTSTAGRGCCSDTGKRPRSGRGAGKPRLGRGARVLGACSRGVVVGTAHGRRGLSGAAARRPLWARGGSGDRQRRRARFTRTPRGAAPAGGGPPCSASRPAPAAGRPAGRAFFDEGARPGLS